MIATFIFSAALGWCGTPYPGWIWYFIFHRQPPPPSWDNATIVLKNSLPAFLAAILAGVCAGLLVRRVYPGESLASIGMAAFAGGRIASDLVNLVKNNFKK